MWVIAHRSKRRCRTTPRPIPRRPRRPRSRANRPTLAAPDVRALLLQPWPDRHRPTERARRRCEALGPSLRATDVRRQRACHRFGRVVLRRRRDITNGLGDIFEPVSQRAVSVAEAFRDTETITNTEITVVPWTYQCRHIGDFNGVFPTGREPRDTRRHVRRQSWRPHAPSPLRRLGRGLHTTRNGRECTSLGDRRGVRLRT